MTSRTGLGRTYGESTAVDTAALQVSALIDGELDAATLDRTIDALLASDALASFWSDAHRAGDWMRSDEVVGIGDGAAAFRAIVARLDAEPTVLAPPRRGGLVRLAASPRFWRTTGLPGVSVAAALVVVAWLAVPARQPVVPTEVAAAATAAEPGRVDVERLTDYVAAHRDVTPFGYRGYGAVRPAAFTTPVERAGATTPR